MASITVQQILGDAKKLVSRLKEHDSSADTLISQARVLSKNLDLAKEYNEEAGSIQQVSSSEGSRSALVYAIKQESRHIRALQAENQELIAILEEHRTVLELIMSKYRQHVTQVLRFRPDSQSAEHRRALKLSKELQSNAQQLGETYEVIKKAIEVDDTNFAREQQRMTQLAIENRGLRHLLSISTPLSPPPSHKEIQTDEPPPTS